MLAKPTLFYGAGVMAVSSMDRSGVDVFSYFSTLETDNTNLTWAILAVARHVNRHLDAYLGQLRV